MLGDFAGSATSNAGCFGKLADMGNECVIHLYRQGLPHPLAINAR